MYMQLTKSDNDAICFLYHMRNYTHTIIMHIHVYKTRMVRGVYIPYAYGSYICTSYTRMVYKIRKYMHGIEQQEKT